MTGDGHRPPAEVRADVATLVAAPPPAVGGGRTAARWAELLAWARTGSVSVARLAEAHVDAGAILAEAGTEPAGSGLYGVWASTAPRGGVAFDSASGTVTGTQPFCSGVDIVDRALLTAVAPDGGTVLVDVGLHPAPTVHASAAPWTTPALADTRTGTVTFDHHRVDAVVGARGWYLDRPGFWHGAIGPAACWAGGAAGIVDHALAHADDDPHRRAAVGDLVAQRHLLATVLDAAGHATDADPHDATGARVRALATRHLVERACAQVVDRFGQAFGPRPFVHDAALAQRVADVALYTRQHHGDRDLAALAGLVLEP
jgi:hypothetical protein